MPGRNGEASEQLDFLVGLGCEFGEGYLFPRPVDRYNAQQMIKHHQVSGGSSKRRARRGVRVLGKAQANTEPVRKKCSFKILVVDDSPIYRKLVEQSPSREDYQILFARNGREALDVFGEQWPAVVITDWSMPDISGLELCRRIRQDFPQHYTYLILITSNSNKEQVVEGLAAGADDYLTKPFHSGELAARVAVGRRIIELHGQIETKNKQLEELALTDSLTGLPNRRAIDLWVDSHFSAAARYGFQIWVVLADLDHFKKVNDTYGHEAGDTVLKKFSELLKSNTRRSNVCGRLGGEEFLLILTHVDRERALVAIDRIRKHIEEQEFRFGSARATVTASFGVKGFCGSQSPEFNALLAHADAALYLAKSKGRNRVEFDPDAI
jgi:diguanylate cyclase (GGDEF)-like protein